MSDIVCHRKDCRACGSTDLQWVFSLKPSPIGDAYVTADKLLEPQPSYPIDLYLCRKCGLAQLLDTINSTILYRDYIYLTSSSVGLVDHFTIYAENVIDCCSPVANALVVDIGSNDGSLLRRFIQLGMRGLGIEPSPAIAEQANANGIETLTDFFTPKLADRIVVDYGMAKIITANNVFANIDNLQEWVDGIERLLDNDGVFVFESYYLADLLQNMVFDFIYHEHLSAFSVKPIQALFSNAGFQLVAIQRIPTKGGSLRYFVQRPGGPLANDGSVSKLLTLEQRIGLYRPETYRVFADKVDQLKKDTFAFLSQAKAAGKTIAGFGASITGTTLIYHFEIGNYLDYLVDDNPAKQGRFSPGLHLPVFDCSALTEHKPDYVILLAWRFADAFIHKYRSYLDAGGGVIIPAPEFKVIVND